MRLLFSPVLALLVLACASNPPPPPPEPVSVIVPASTGPVLARPVADAPVEKVAAEDGPEAWLQRWAGNTCSGYDYHPHGGLQNVWCHRPAALALSVLRDVAKVPVFVSGPHEGDLNLTSAKSFGHYDPAFVQYLVEHGVHERGSMVQRATQASFDKNLKPLASIFWRTRAKIKAEPACFEREKKAYAAAISKGKTSGYYERWFYFMNPAFCTKPARSENWYMGHGMDGGVDGNVTKTVVGFWLRRSLDGTFDAFSTGLEKLMTAYDPESMRDGAP